MSNDELSDLLRRELHLRTEDLEPRGDLVERLRTRHGARVRRTRALTGLTALVVVGALLTAVFLVAKPAAPPAAPPVLDRVVPQARAAFDAADGSIAHITGDAGEVWFLRAEQTLRTRYARGEEVIDTVYTTAGIERVDHRQATVERIPHGTGGGQMAHYAMPDGMFDPRAQLHSPTTRWDGRRDRIGDREAFHLTGYYGPADEPFEIWVDTGTYLPLRVRMPGRSAELEWLPATAENRGLLTHEVPPDFVRTGY